MRDDDDADIAHALSLQNFATMAAIISARGRAPGSIWPIERSPRNEARPRIAFIGTVASAAAAAAVGDLAPQIAPPRERVVHRHQHVEHGLLPDVATCRAP